MEPKTLERFFSKVKIEDCWEWIGCTTGGYGRFYLHGKLTLAHRTSYEHFIGEIGDLQLDHLCRNRACVNPNHLEAVTGATNSRRGDSNKGGHLQGDQAVICYGLKENGTTFRITRQVTAANAEETLRKLGIAKQAALAANISQNEVRKFVRTYV